MHGKHNRIRNLARLVVPFVFALPLAAQDSMQFNVPYLCSDGSTYVVHKCEKGPKFEFCYYQRDQNSERYNVRSQVANQMATCKIKGPASAVQTSAQAPGDLQNTRWDCGSGATMTVFQCQKQNGQDNCFVKIEMNEQFLLQAPKPRSEIAEKVKLCKPSSSFNPPYLSEFPTVDRVIQGMKVSTPRETMIRSMGAFYQLSDVIKVLAGPRATSGLLPDERKFLDQYSTAQSTLVQLAEKQWPGRPLSLETNPFRFNRTDPKFGFEGIPMWVYFLSPGLQAQFAQIVGGNNPAYNAKIQEEKRLAIQRLQADTQAAQAQAEAQAHPMRQDAGSVAARRCIESGRSETECIGEGLKTGLNEMFGPMVQGVLGKDAPAIGGSSGPPGLRMNGRFDGQGGFSATFQDEAVIVQCGTLIPQSFPYIVERTSGQVMLKIPTQPNAVVSALRPDGKLAGPGPIQLVGRVVVGSSGGGYTGGGYQEQTHTTAQERQIDAADAQNYAGTDAVHQNGMEYSVSEQVPTTDYVPTAPTYRAPTVVTAPKTERCTAGVMPGSPLATLSNLAGNMLDPSGKRPLAPVGLRMHGTYAAQGGGLSIEFRSDTATVECGEAHAAEPYTVQFSGGQTLITLQNAGAPFTVQLEPNGTLVGSGTVDVSGRVVTGSRGNEITYAPRNARCTMGTLAPSK
jgi:hypothetical protein